MELTHEFTVPAHVERAWEVLTDVEQIAPCMPGAELTEVDGDTYHGMVKVKVGPITVQYKGTASFVERDEAARRVVLTAAGRDARGQGNASATVTFRFFFVWPKKFVNMSLMLTSISSTPWFEMISYAGFAR